MEHSFDDFKLIVVYPSPKLHIDDLVILSKCDVPGMKKGINEVIAKRVLSSSDLLAHEVHGTFSDHEYFCIHDDLFGRIKSTHQFYQIVIVHGL